MTLKKPSLKTVIIVAVVLLLIAAVVINYLLWLGPETVHINYHKGG